MSVCRHFAAAECLSCPHLAMPMAQQLQRKMTTLAGLLPHVEPAAMLAPVSGAALAFRNKAKMVALGAAHQPILGIVSPQGHSVSLCDCPLYPADMQQLLARLQQFVQQAGIPPYRVDKAKGELKFVLLTRSQVNGEYMLRFVLRSEQAIGRIERELPRLLAEYPQIKVVSVNLQPVHMARLEGDEEIFLTAQTRLAEVLNQVPLYIRPKSFFQTNPEVAAQLYATARDWTAELNPTSVWDLFCGVGGFGLHCASQKTALTGIEIEAEAIACASMSAMELGLSNVSFTALDSTEFASGQQAQDVPDVIIVNPPRRGIGASLCQSLSQFAPAHIIYSSCNAKTMAQDLEHIHGYKVTRLQLFDMFPHTDHFEVMALLERQPD
ncbi:23S rRNA (uracil(747)-C(5))-methyltransferase RlmC [Shewanella sp. NIFS-20-20]|uniref:23S rRNA (uracil(747)-C(5))-methyltransferase RlmC n=1 Tax=Shewanella sp. NIFS-20-20 TaxID=2853806 RepID=UPI001C45A4E1|nr:23S rRNA (uracil(747)-C(5))-methyltransferase RlmC [Shewanella sp. NIFS-20-20]MBV7314732.1 23S rRNA (uracil(747)-C(5))-methyltransferase RlmC [Shewanella sp. NIFS-20-20]